jgi:serine phosphatase RsbU (regulator of sigma subunit)
MLSRHYGRCASGRTAVLAHIALYGCSVPTLNLRHALRRASSGDPASVADVVVGMAAEVGATDAILYLVDFAQETLEPLPSRTTHAEVPHSEAVAGTMAGRAFITQAPAIAERPAGARVWVPVVEGSDRTGVLAVTVPEASDELVTVSEELGLLAGYLIATHTRSTDLFNLYRRRRSLSLPASMQWDLLPPLVLKTDRIKVAGHLEPAYTVAGDCFDYALNDAVFDLAIFDPVGHGVASALIAALCIGAYRHDRRESVSQQRMHTRLDEVMISEFSDMAFTTGQLARVDLDTGAMTWTNAGHPLPMLVRGGQVIKHLECEPTLPWGLGALTGPASPATAVEVLEPGDSVLFYTDGVVESHMPGTEPFGLDRLSDLLGQNASELLEPEEIVRRLVRAVLDHQHDNLTDDATLLLFQWNGASPYDDPEPSSH